MLTAPPRCRKMLSERAFRDLRRRRTPDGVVQINGQNVPVRLDDAMLQKITGITAGEAAMLIDLVISAGPGIQGDIDATAAPSASDTARSGSSAQMVSHRNPMSRRPIPTMGAGSAPTVRASNS